MARSVDKNLKKLPLGAIKPTGWLLDEMTLMANLQRRLGALRGLVRNGEWESSEELPRFVRGITLLGAALDDKHLQDKATSFLQTILSSANEGGDFGPKGRMTSTPKIEGVKALLTYYEATGNEKILPFLKRFFKNQFNTFSMKPLWYDSRARLLEEIPAIEAVYRETDLEWLHDLGEKLRDASNDWFRLADKFPYKRGYAKYVSPGALKRIKKIVETYDVLSAQPSKKLKPLTADFVQKQWKKQLPAIETDGVNLAKAAKYAATYGRFIGDDNLKNLSVKLINALNKYHGTPMGMFASDFHLREGAPTDGIDLRASVEMIESLVEVLRETADYSLADILERIVFNVVPTACFADCTAVQDVTLVNQVESSATRTMPLSESEYSNAYLTKKLSRGAISALSAFPLYMQAACMVKDNELNFLTYTPCTMDMLVDGCKLTLSERTSYPFRNTVVFKVEHTSGEPQVKINFRVPKNTTMQLISGGQVVASGTKQISVKCTLRTGSTFMLKMDIPLTVEEVGKNSFSLYKGNLLMSLKMPCDIKISEEDRRIYYVNFIKKWNVAPMLTRRGAGGNRSLYEAETTSVNEISSTPFSFETPPFELHIRCKNVINWDYDVNGFTQIPSKPVFSEESLERIFLPVGCSLLHITQFPKCLK